MGGGPCRFTAPALVHRHVDDHGSWFHVSTPSRAKPLLARALRGRVPRRSPDRPPRTGAFDRRLRGGTGGDAPADIDRPDTASGRDPRLMTVTRAPMPTATRAAEVPQLPRRAPPYSRLYTRNAGKQQPRPPCVLVEVVSPHLNRQSARQSHSSVSSIGRLLSWPRWFHRRWR